VIDFIKNNLDFLDDHQLSFFEMTVAMAFDYFAKEKVDIAIIEVGLGGRLDSTNIIKPEVSLITNIGLDHTDMLGDTLDKIAFEKAGIIKNGVPVIVSEYQEEIAEVFQNIARSKQAKLLFASSLELPNYKTDLLGNYQSKNIKGVVAVLKTLKDFIVEEEHIKAGLQHVIQNTGLLGRWQVLGQQPKIVCDTAHNKEGLRLVLDQISQEEYDTLHIVLGFVKDKNLDVVLPLFPKQANYYFCKPNIPRGLDGDALQNEATNFGLKGDVHYSVDAALKAAKKDATATDLIFIGGSNFVVAEVV
jgi:dihydrofolate synthase/folylpolyglutamate synthase